LSDVRDQEIKKSKLSKLPELDVSTKAIGGVLLQLQNGIEKPVIFVSHALSHQATRWEIIELELYAFVYCVKNLTSNLLCKLYGPNGPS